MRPIFTVALSALLVAALGSPASADVQLSIHDGRVSIVAKNATVGQILAEWARVGQTKIVNLERVPRDLITIELRDVPERQALDVVLRTASGYVAANRATAGDPTVSRFERVIVMPPSVAPASAPPAAMSAGGRYAKPAAAEPVYPSSELVVVGGGAEPADEPNPMDADDEPPPVLGVAGAVQPPDARQQLVNSQRRALETVDPREFKLPPQPPAGAVMVAPALPRVLVPGTIVQPAKPRPPGAPE